MKNLAVILFISLSLKLVLLLSGIRGSNPDFFLSPDSMTYLRPYESLLKTHTFGPPGSPEIFRTPGYPMFILFSNLFGKPPYSVLLFQILLSLFSSLLIYRIGRQFIPEKGALFAAFLFSVDPLSNLYTLKILSETVFTFFLLVFMERWIKARMDRTRDWFLLTILAGILTYIRPIAIFIILGPILSLFYHFYKKEIIFLHVVKKTILILLSLSLWMMPWVCRNYIQAGFMGISTLSSYNLYYYRAAAVEAKAQGRDYYSKRSEMGAYDGMIFIHSHPELKTATLTCISQSLSKEAAKIILAHPWIALQVHFKGLITMLLDPNSVELLKYFGKYKEGGGILSGLVSKGILTTLQEMAASHSLLFKTTLILSPWAFLLLIVAFLGIFQVEPRSRIILIYIFVYFSLLSAGPEATGRFRVPIIPVMVLLSGAYLHQKLSAEHDPQKLNPPSTG